MSTDLKVFVVIVKDEDVLLQQTGEELFKLPNTNVNNSEDIMGAASQVLRSLYLSGSTEFKHVIGVYELNKLEEEKKTIAVGLYAMCSKLSPQTHGRLYEHTAIEAYAEEEKPLEEPSFAAKILKDYLSGIFYPLELLKVAEERKI